MKITEDVPRYPAQQGVTDDEAVKEGLEEKAGEFLKKVAEVYPKA